MLKRALKALGIARIGRYRCGFCDLQFDSERRNCPACGGPILEE